MSTLSLLWLLAGLITSYVFAAVLQFGGPFDPVPVADPPLMIGAVAGYVVCATVVRYIRRISLAHLSQGIVDGFSRNITYLPAKQLIDVLGAIVTLPITLPLMLLTAPAIRVLPPSERLSVVSAWTSSRSCGTSSRGRRASSARALNSPSLSKVSTRPFRTTPTGTSQSPA